MFFVVILHLYINYINSNIVYWKQFKFAELLNKQVRNEFKDIHIFINIRNTYFIPQRFRYYCAIKKRLFHYLTHADQLYG